MDETAIWQDMLSNTTDDSIGHNTIAMKTAGHEKTKVSVCWTAKADGTKLKPFIIFPGAKRETKLLNEELKDKWIVVSSSNGWMNDKLTLDWVRSVLGKFSFTRWILAWDSFKCQVMETVKQELHMSKINPLIIPGDYTKYIQAPDVVWNKPFEANVTEKYDSWMAGEFHSFTVAGNMHAPPLREIVQCILAAWDGLDKIMFINSFKSCVLILAVDRSEDGHIHCFKENQRQNGSRLFNKPWAIHARRILSTGSQNLTSKMRHQIAW